MPLLAPEQLLRDTPRLADIPGVIVHGRYDAICPLQSAWELHQAWPKADFQVIADAGHAAFEPGIAAALVAATPGLCGPPFGAGVIGLLQRVSEASVAVDGVVIGAIQRGLLVLVGVQPHDDEARAERLLARLLGYRVFPDDAGKMNLSLTAVGGGLLLVPQFTLAASTAKGTRASFTSAAPPAVAARLFHHLVARAKDMHGPVATGRFGADMRVQLINDGPVTFWLEG